MASTCTPHGPGCQGKQVGNNELLVYIKTIVTWETVFETKGNLFGSPAPPVGCLEMSEEGSLGPVAGTCWGEEEADPEGD